jgi:CRP-like cAMP-binding protein
VAAAVVDRVGVLGSMRITGLVVPLTALLLSPVLAAAGRVADRRRDEMADRVALLEQLRIFEGAARAAVEEVAAGMTAEPLPAGTVVIREGEPADDFFIAVSGTFSVSVAGNPLPDMGPGDYFGEIGLLRGSPRTATVIATTDAQVYRIRGTDFLRAITQGPAMSAALRLGIDVRLARTTPGLAGGRVG